MSHFPSGDERILSAVLAHQLRSQPPDGACPDAETLAVYAERRVAADEQHRLEAHVASCVRCQAHLAALVRSEPSPVPDEAPSAWFRLPWRWVVPVASAGLVVLAVWVARAPVAPSQEARSAQQASPSTAANTPAATPAEPYAPAPKTAAPVLERANEAQAQPQAPADARGRREAFQAAPAPLEARDTARSARTKRESERADAPADRNQARQAQLEAAASTPAGRAAAVSPERPAGLEESTARAPRASRWRLAGGAVERTIDGGVSWTGRFQPVDTTLRAISCPSPTVCWAVGDEGAVYRTRDGEAWIRVAFHERVPLVVVDAGDPDRAQVSTADGRRFETTDGGVQWRAVP